KDTSAGITAADVLNTYTYAELELILMIYVDQHFAGKILTAVLKERDQQPFDTSARLVDLLYNTIYPATRLTGGHPAKRTFQALRVEVNGELEAIEQVIPVITSALNIGGRVVFMSYQSLEDKLVKSTFKTLTTSSTPAGLPMDLPGTAAHFKT